MKYMLLIYHNEQDWDGYTEGERQQIYGEYRDLIAELSSQGKFIMGDELQPVTTASTVSVRDGKQVVTDGPFAETREQVGGYFLIDAANRDEAVAIAARIPSARTGRIEVRPVMVTAEAAGAV